MKKYSQTELNPKLINHTKLKLSASLFMLLNNVREIKSTENPFNPYEKPEVLLDIENILLNGIISLDGSLKEPIDNRLSAISVLQAAKINLLDFCESFYCYFSLNSILAEIIVDYRRIKLLEEEQEKPMDFHQFLRDVTDFIEKDKSPELRAGNISYMMKCFPLSMTKEKYADYVKGGFNLLFQGEGKNYVSNAAKALKFRFLPTGLENYGKYFPQIKDYFDTLIRLEFDKMNAEELEETAQGLEDNLDMLEEMSAYLSLLHESINFCILVMTFSKDLDYLTDGNPLYKDAFHYGLQVAEKGEDEALAENAEEMFDEIMTGLIDSIIADEKEGFLNESAITETLPQETFELFKITRLITHIYYEMLADIIYNVEPEYGENVEKADTNFVSETADDIMAYITTSLKDLSPKTAKLIKRLFLTCIPAPFSTEEFADYAHYVLDNTLSYSKKLRILDSVGMVFDATGFMENAAGHHHDHHDHNHHEHGPDCDHDHHH